MTRRTRDLVEGIIIATVLIFLGLGLAYARASGLVPDGDDNLAARAFGVATGLVLAYYSNVVPKRNACIDPASESAARKQRLLRFTGWAFMLAGLAYAAIWAFAPINDGLWAMIPVAAAMIVVAARVLRSRPPQEGGA
jgi:peptidoglycan/LPS O-acetylase OafA/YrhL